MFRVLKKELVISQANEEDDAATCCGPAENAHVSNYRLVLSKNPLSVYRKKWSEVENQNLRKGVKQQLQKMIVQISFDRCRYIIISNFLHWKCRMYRFDILASVFLLCLVKKQESQALDVFPCNLFLQLLC